MPSRVGSRRRWREVGCTSREYVGWGRSRANQETSIAFGYAAGCARRPGETLRPRRHARVGRGPSCRRRATHAGNPFAFGHVTKSTRRCQWVTVWPRRWALCIVLGGVRCALSGNAPSGEGLRDRRRGVVPRRVALRGVHGVGLVRLLSVDNLVRTGLRDLSYVEVGSEPSSASVGSSSRCFVAGSGARVVEAVRNSSSSLSAQALSCRVLPGSTSSSSSKGASVESSDGAPRKLWGERSRRPRLGVLRGDIASSTARGLAAVRLGWVCWAAGGGRRAMRSGRLPLSVLCLPRCCRVVHGRRSECRAHQQ